MMKNRSLKRIFAPTAMLRNGLIVTVALATSLGAQTFEVGGQQGQPQQTTQPAAKGKKKAAKSDNATPSTAPGQEESGIGTFGESINVQREQRAADDALRHNNAAAAYAHAQRSVEMAPN